MKDKKILKPIIAIFTAGITCLSFIAGCSGDEPCTHVVDWSTTVEATCTTEGYRTGTCTICGEVVTEDIPIDSTAHAVDESADWTITTYPTETTEGVAKKPCVNSNGEHDVEVTLPVVPTSGNGGYTESDRYQIPTAIATGKQKLKLSCEYGDIEFEVTLPKRELNGLASAVEVATSLGSYIRYSTGTYVQNGSANVVSAFFGDDYTHVVAAADNAQYWYSYAEDGSLYGVSAQYEKDTSPQIVNTTANISAIVGSQQTVSINSVDTVKTIDGVKYGAAIANDGKTYHYTYTYYDSDDTDTADEDETDKTYLVLVDEVSGGTETVLDSSLISENNLIGFVMQDSGAGGSYYGVEDALASLYNLVETKRADENDTTLAYITSEEKFEKNNDGSINAAFSFYYYSTRYMKYEVSFSTDDTGAITSFNLTIRILQPLMLADGENGERLYYLEDVKDESGNIVHYKNETALAYEYPLYNGSPNYATSGGNYVYETDSDGNAVYMKDAEGNYLTDASGNYVRKKLAHDRSEVSSWYTWDDADVYSWTITQYTKDTYAAKVKNGTLAEAEKNENPHPAPSVYVRTFSVDSAGLYSSSDNNSTSELIETRTVTEVESGVYAVTLPTTTRVMLTLSQTDETASFINDPVNKLTATFADGTVKELTLNTGSDSSYAILGYVSGGSYTTKNSMKITLNSKYAGTVDIALTTRSGNGEVILRVTFEKQAPSEITVKGYVYTVLSGEATTAVSTLNESSYTPLIVGQELQVYVTVPGDEASYASTGFSIVNLPDGVSLAEGTADTIVASKAGDYTITVRSDALNSSGIYAEAQFTIRVSEKPDLETMLVGNTFKGTVKVLIGSANNPSTTNISVEFTADSVTLYAKTTDTSVESGKTYYTRSGEEGSYTYTEVGNPTDADIENYYVLVNRQANVKIGSTTYVYGYLIENGELIVVAKDTPTNDSYDLTITVNEAGDLVVRHKTGLGNDTEEKVLTKSAS